MLARYDREVQGSAMAEEEGVVSILESLKLDKYRWGICQALVYDRKDTSVFGEGFLGELYFKFKGNRYNRREGNGILETLFCGMQDVSFPAITSYLASVPLCILGVWKDDKFDVAGIQFPTVRIGVPGGQKACFAGYGFVPAYWGSTEVEVLAALGIAVLFQELDVISVHGVRYADNELTARFMAKFGFKDVGTLPNYMMRAGKLTAATLSTLPREVFEQVVEKMVLEAYRAKKSE